MRAFAFIYAIVFLSFGVAGFIPSWVQDGYLGIFRVNFWLNSLYLLSGIYGLIVTFSNKRHARNYFQIIGIFYGALAVLGFIYKESDIFGVIASNPPVTWFQVILAVAALVLGYGGRD